jgi:hypothetical protein
MLGERRGLHRGHADASLIDRLLALRPCIFGKNEISSPSLGMQAPITETLTTNGAVGGAVTAY